MMSSRIEIILPDHVDVVNQIESTIQRTPEQLDLVLQQASAVFERSLKTMVQTETHGSGLTAASIETRKEANLTYGIGSYTRGHILRFLDRGTGLFGARGSPFLVMPVARKALHFWIKETGDEVFAAFCIVNGIIPFNFFERAIQSHLSEIDNIMKEKVKT